PEIRLSAHPSSPHCRSGAKDPCPRRYSSRRRGHSNRLQGSRRVDEGRSYTARPDRCLLDRLLGWIGGCSRSRSCRTPKHLADRAGSPRGQRSCRALLDRRSCREWCRHAAPPSSTPRLISRSSSLPSGGNRGCFDRNERISKGYPFEAHGGGGPPRASACLL